MINYCSCLSSEQRLLPTSNVLAAHFSFCFWLFCLRSVIVWDFSVSVNGICLSPFLRISVSVNVNYTAWVAQVTLCKTEALLSFVGGRFWGSEFAT